jgi:predicted branched-subunit amino acid permease
MTSETGNPSQPTRLTAAGIRRGAWIGLPFMVSSLIYGVAFGVMASDTGLSGLEAVLMSLLVFSGTAQIAVLQAWALAPGLLPIFLIVFVANVRYLMMGAALRPWFGPIGSKAIWPLTFLVDGAFAIAMRLRAEGDHDAGLLVGAGGISYIGWAIGTAIGGASGQLLTNPKAIGLDFIVLAFCAAAAADMADKVPRWWPAIAAVAVIVALDRFAPGPWIVVAAGVTAALVAAALYRPDSADAEAPSA